MSAEEDGGSQNRWVRKEYKYGRVGRTMIEIHLPALPLLDVHPRALKGKITDKMAGQPDKQSGNRDVENHRAAFSSW